MESTVLGLITARGGSKSIPRKNIKLVAGKPLIAWTIEAAMNCPDLNRLIVSTDDHEIAQVCRQWGAEVPFLRPAELAQDYSPHMDVILHAIDWLANHDSYVPSHVLLLQPTSPLRTTQDITESITMSKERNADGIVSVCESPAHPWLIKRLTAEGCLADFYHDKPEGYLPRQKFPPAYVVNGAIYLARLSVLVKKKTWYTDRTYPYIMLPEHSLDVDTSWDMYLADLVLRDRLEKNGD